MINDQPIGSGDLVGCFLVGGEVDHQLGRIAVGVLPPAQRSNPAVGLDVVRYQRQMPVRIIVFASYHAPLDGLGSVFIGINRLAIIPNGPSEEPVADGTAGHVIVDFAPTWRHGALHDIGVGCLEFCTKIGRRVGGIQLPGLTIEIRQRIDEAGQPRLFGKNIKVEWVITLAAKLFTGVDGLIESEVRLFFDGICLGRQHTGQFIDHHVDAIQATAMGNHHPV